MSRSTKSRLTTQAAIADKQVVVVGANRGIGLEVCRLLRPLKVLQTPAQYYSMRVPNVDKPSRCVC